MSHYSETAAKAAEAQTTLHLQDAERLPALFYLWMPLIIAVVLSLTWHLNPHLYEDLFVGETRALELSHLVLPIISTLLCLRILALPEARRDRLVRSVAPPRKRK